MPSIFDSLIQQESGGRPGVKGPLTKYGQALGLTQMLPATAQEMARKLGVPWNPALMTDKSPQGAAYQRQLGQAYFNEGLSKTGNERDALRYYHGGPNRSMWGPKTNAYADTVLARANQGQSMPIQPRKPRQTLGSLLDQGMSDQPLGFDGMAPQGMTLGAVAMPQIPQGPDHKGLFPGKDWKTLASIALGAIGDGLMSWGTGTPQHGAADAFVQNQRDNEQRQFDREQFNQRLEEKRQEALARAAEPPQFLQNLQAYQALPPEQQKAYLSYLDATQPIAVSGPQGTQRVTRSMPATAPQPGAEEDGYIFMGGDPADPKNWKAR